MAWARTVVDSANRMVEIPDEINRVFAAGAPASVVIYALKPQVMLGWTRELNDAEKRYVAAPYRSLQGTGRLTGRGGDANVERMLALKPDLIIDFGSVRDTYVDLANRIQEQTGIPYLLIDGKFDETANSLRLLGSVLGVPERGELLASNAEKTFAELESFLSSVPLSTRPRTYLARQPDGLQTGVKGSLSTEIIERAGGRNVADVQATFGRQCVPFQIPIGEADSFKGVVNVADPNADVPAELADEVEAARERLIEAAAESDDELADRYLSGEELSAEEIESALRGAVLRRELVPILATSATDSVGVTEFLDMVNSYLPSPEDGVKPKLFKAGSSDEVSFDADPSAPLAAMVFKTTADPFVGKLSLFRVYQGTMRSNSEVWDANQGQSERVGQLYLPKGKNQENLTEVVAGTSAPSASCLPPSPGTRCAPETAK